MRAVNCYGLELTEIPQNLTTNTEVCFWNSLSAMGTDMRHFETCTFTQRSQNELPILSTVKKISFHWINWPWNVAWKPYYLSHCLPAAKQVIINQPHPSTHPLIRWVPGALFLGTKRPGRKANHSHLSSAEFKECVELHLHSPNKPSWHGAQLKKVQGELYLTKPTEMLGYPLPFMEFPKNHYNIIFPSIPKSFERSLPFKISDKNSLCFSYLSHVCYTLCPYPPWLDHTSNIWWSVIKTDEALHYAISNYLMSFFPTLVQIFSLTICFHTPLTFFFLP
jgi:hypothetical protein